MLSLPHWQAINILLTSVTIVQLFFTEACCKMMENSPKDSAQLKFGSCGPVECCSEQQLRLAIMHESDYTTAGSTEQIFQVSSYCDHIPRKAPRHGRVARWGKQYRPIHLEVSTEEQKRTSHGDGYSEHVCVSLSISCEQLSVSLIR